MHHQYEEKLSADDVSYLIILNQQILQAEEDGNQAVLYSLMVSDFTIVRASGLRQDREIFLGAVEANAHRDRTAEKPEVQLYSDCAVVSIRVTTSKKQDGAPTARHFWNT